MYFSTIFLSNGGSDYFGDAILNVIILDWVKYVLNKSV